MKRTDKGSILVEAIVMIGLISALTPVLYKHVSDRRSEVEDINKANTFLLIQRETERYLKENRGNVASGLLPLSNIGLARLDNKYVIGIRKQDDDVYAMIAERETSNGGNDMKAGKVASLIGVSAGIYSAINSANAYGINGVWIESVSDYGLNGVLPTGSVVVTTQYNQERQKFYSSDIDWSDGDSVTVSAAKGVFGQVCIGNTGRCINSWDEVEGAVAGDINLSLCFNDMNNGLGYSDFCKEMEDTLQNCQSVSEYYSAKERDAPSAYYWLGPNAHNLTKRACYFAEGRLPTNTEIINGCSTHNYEQEFACAYDYENSWLTENCDTIKAADGAAISAFYTFATEEGFTDNKACVFDETAQDVITKCNSDGLGSLYCSYGNEYNITKTCANIIANWNTAPTGFYNTTTANEPCVFYGGALANGEQVIKQCNADTSGTGAACRYGHINGVTQSCANIIANWSSAPTGWYNITNATSVTNSPCVFNGATVGNCVNAVSQCNGSATNAACKVGLNGNWNTSCANAVNSCSSSLSGTRWITTNSGTSYTQQSCCNTSADCPTNYYCNQTTKVCTANVVNCTTNANCANNGDGVVWCRYKDGKCVNTRCTAATSSTYCPASKYCYEEGNLCYTAAEIIDGCNAAKAISSPYCLAGYRNSINNSCAAVFNFRSTYPAVHYITNASAAIETCCTRNNANAVMQLTKGTNITISTSIATATYSSIGTVATLKTCAGYYKITLKGQSTTARGGIVWGTGYASAGQTLLFRAVAGGRGYWTTNPWWGGAGVCMLQDNVLKLCAGGSGSNCFGGGGGYVGGKANRFEGTPKSGYGWSGSVGASTSWYTSPSNASALGGMEWSHSPSMAWGGTSYCSGYTCTYQAGCNYFYTNSNVPTSVWGNFPCSSWAWGNSGNGKAYIGYCGGATSGCPANI